MSAPSVPPYPAPVDAEVLAAQLARVEARLADVLAELAVERAGRERRAELVHDVNRIAGAGIASVSDALADAERRGWFDAARRGASVGGRLADAVRLDWPQEPPSMLALLRCLRDPRSRLGLARAISLLRAIGTDEPLRPSAATSSAADGSHPAKE
jgi:hypothetical protein